MNIKQLALLSELINIDAERKMKGQNMRNTQHTPEIGSKVENTRSTRISPKVARIQPVIQCSSGERVFVTFETPYSGERAGCDMAALTAHESNPNRVQFNAHRTYGAAAENCEHANYVMRETVLHEAQLAIDADGQEYAITRGGIRIALPRK